jgi:hypothetical protein
MMGMEKAVAAEELFFYIISRGKYSERKSREILKTENLEIIRV